MPVALSIYTGTLKVYPDPAKDILNVSGILEEAAIGIFDISGKSILTGSLNDSFNKINISGLPRGVYILKLKIGDSIVMKRFVKTG